MIAEADGLNMRISGFISTNCRCGKTETNNQSPKLVNIGQKAGKSRTKLGKQSPAF